MTNRPLVSVWVCSWFMTSCIGKSFLNLSSHCRLFSQQMKGSRAIGFRWFSPEISSKWLAFSHQIYLHTWVGLETVFSGHDQTIAMIPWADAHGDDPMSGIFSFSPLALGCHLMLQSPPLLHSSLALILPAAKWNKNNSFTSGKGSKLKGHGWRGRGQRPSRHQKL